MLKNSFIIMTLCCVSTAALSASTASDFSTLSDRLSGWYVGGQLGSDDLKVEDRASYYQQKLSTQIQHARGPNAGLFAGVGKAYSHFYIGLEGYKSISSAKTQYRTVMDDETISYSDLGLAGFDVISGVILNNGTLIYGRGGLGVFHFLRDADSRYTHWRDDVFETAAIHVGAGVQVPLSDTLYLRGEWSNSILNTLPILGVPNERSVSNVSLALIKHW